MNAREPVVALGAGRMGRGIAIVFAYAGHPVAIVDFKPREATAFEQLAADAREEIRGTLTVLARLGLFEPHLERANKVYAVATHGIFSGRAFETLSASPLAGILVTDTVPLRDGAPPLIRQLTSADILTDSVRRIFTDDSVSEIFAGENQLF